MAEDLWVYGALDAAEAQFLGDDLVRLDTGGDLTGERQSSEDGGRIACAGFGLVEDDDRAAGLYLAP